MQYHQCLSSFDLRRQTLSKLQFLFLSHWFLFIVCPSYCIFTLIVPHSSPHPSIFCSSFPPSSLTLASIVYPSHPHTSLALSPSFSLTSFSSHIWIPLSSQTPDSLSSLTLLSFSLYLSNLLLSSHVPVTPPEVVLSELCQRVRLDCSYCNNGKFNKSHRESELGWTPCLLHSFAPQAV